MSDVKRLRDELALAEALEPLEKTREAMHANNTPETVATYRKASEKVVDLRQAFRTKYPPAAGEGVAAPETVKVTGKVVNP